MAASQTQDMKPLEVSQDSLQSLPPPRDPGAGSSPSLVSQCRAGPAQPLASGGTSAGGAQLVLVRTHSLASRGLCRGGRWSIKNNGELLSLAPDLGHTRGTRGALWSLLISLETGCSLP